MDWLERGHGGGDGLRPMIRGSSKRAADRVSIRSVLRGGDVRSPRKPRRRTKALVGWLVYCCIGVGGTAAAFTVRDTLFPQLGGPSKALWASPAPEVPVTTEHGASSTAGDDRALITIAPAIIAAAEEAGPGAFIDAQAVPSASSPDAENGKAVDTHGPSANADSATGTSVAHGPGGGHGTIVDEQPAEPSASGPGPSAGADPTATTTVSTPGSPAAGTTTTVDPDPSGKGKGGGGGGDGGGGGGHGGDPPPTTTIP